MGITTRRTVRDQEEACALLDRLADSGLKLPKFCAELGIDGRSLNCWRRNLARRRRPGVTSAPAPQRLRLVEILPSAPPQPAASYRVSVGDVVIELDDHFDERTLARLLRVVGGC